MVGSKIAAVAYFATTDMQIHKLASLPLYMAFVIVEGQSDLQAKIDYMHDVFKKREAQDQTVTLAICFATDANCKLVERSVVCNLSTVCPQIWTASSCSCSNSLSS